LTYAKFTFLIDCGSSGMKIFLFTSVPEDCLLVGPKDNFWKKIGRLADAAKGNYDNNFHEVQRFLTAAFENAIDTKFPGPSTARDNARAKLLRYEIAAYATAGNRIIAEEDDTTSWERFVQYLAPVTSGTLHGTEEAKMEFLAVNFAHRRNQNFVHPDYWFNMVSTGGASLQFGLVYKKEMYDEFEHFFIAVKEASLQCNIERIIFDWIDVFAMTKSGRSMVFRSIFAEYHAISRQHVTQLYGLKLIKTPNKEVKKEIKELQDELDEIYLDFLAQVKLVCDESEGCFVGLSFLGIIGAKGTCADNRKLDSGYHIIAGVDKFKSVFEIFQTDSGADVIEINPRATEVNEALVEKLIMLDVLLDPLYRLIHASGRKFLPAGNWGTGLTLYADGSKVMLPVYVHTMTALLGLAFEVDASRKTDWTYGAAWLTNAYETCNFGDTRIADVRFELEERSIMSLETALSTFL